MSGKVSWSRKALFTVGGCTDVVDKVVFKIVALYLLTNLSGKVSWSQKALFTVEALLAS